jgi:hypothetical protein
VLALRDHYHRRTERKEIGLARERRHHRHIDDQSQRMIPTRGRGLQGRITPDRMRGRKYGVISPSFSVMNPTRQERLVMMHKAECESALIPHRRGARKVPRSSRTFQYSLASIKVAGNNTRPGVSLAV